MADFLVDDEDEDSQEPAQVDADENDPLALLVSMFAHVSRDTLAVTLAECDLDVQTAVDFLLTHNPEPEGQQDQPAPSHLSLSNEAEFPSLPHAAPSADFVPPLASNMLQLERQHPVTSLGAGGAADDLPEVESVEWVDLEDEDQDFDDAVDSHPLYVESLDPDNPHSEAG